MAMALLLATPQFTIKKTFLPEKRSLSHAIWNSNVRCPTICKATYEVVNDQSQTIHHQSSKFEPSIWTDDHIQSLHGEYKDEMYAKECRVIREEVRMMFNKIENEIDQLEFIDVLQRLGVAYHFTNEIRNILDNIYNTQSSKLKNNLYATALKFRLLRQHGYDISTDIFVSSQDEMCNFKKVQFVDIEGILSMYEASFYSFEDETVLDEARDFTSKFLKEYLNQNGGNLLSLQISHALELPLHWRIARWETRWFINIYETQQNKSDVLLQLAKLDFNILQRIYQEDLKYTSRWWKRTELGEKLSFIARDRLVENFVWTVGTNFKPEFEYYRKVMTKVNSFLTTIDDMYEYDVYGKLEELELFTEAIDRWDLNGIDSLPKYMKICFLAVFNFVNELGFETLKKCGYYITPFLKKAWADLCKAYLIEAKWYHSGYTPTLEEYLENAWVSICTPVMLTHAYFLNPQSFKMEDLTHLEENPNIIRFSAMILRLSNDLASYKQDTGDMPKSIQCYTNETGASEEEACEYVKSMISSLWKKMNKEAHTSPFTQYFIDTSINLARVALFMYHNGGEGHTIQDPEIQNRITSLIVEPIPI